MNRLATRLAPGVQLGLLALPASVRDPDLHLVLDWPPSVNRTWSQFVIPPAVEKIQARISLHGWDGFYQWLRKETRVSGRKDEKAENYRQAAAWLMAAKRRRFGDSDVAAWMIFHPPRQSKPDMDNRVKQIFDAAELARIVSNDRNVADFRCTRGDKVPNGSVELMLWEL